MSGFDCFHFTGCWLVAGASMSRTRYMLLLGLQIWEPAFTKELSPILIKFISSNYGPATNEIVVLHKCFFNLKNYIGLSLVGSQLLVQCNYSILSNYTMSNNIINTSFSSRCKI